MNLFTAAERVMFTKNNIDYRNCNIREESLEEFSIKNMDTVNLKFEEHARTKSIILAPFNTSAGNSIFMNKELHIQNDLIKYNGKVRALNKNYELNNNCEIDNGMIISPNGNTFNSINNSLGNNYENAYNKKKTDISKIKQFSSKDITSGRASGLVSPVPEGISSITNQKPPELRIDETIVQSVVALGYSYNFVVKSLISSDYNYSTASYFLMLNKE